MQGHQDVSGFIRAFAGDHRYIVDYLADEVLQRQSDSVRSFLLQTSILDRLHGPLCDAVTGREDGSARLEALHRGNFFVVPLDDRRQWYRYHHLFADVLSTHLRAEQPALVATLHQRASVWYEQHEAAADAIHHALAAADFERAADLVELALPDMRRRRHDAIRLGWFRALPDELIGRRPVLSVVYAHVLLAGGTLEGVEDRLRDAERWLDPTLDPGSPAEDSRPSVTMVVVDQETFRQLPGLIAIARAGLALALGDVPQAVSHARRVLDLVPADDHFSRGGASAFLGLASWASGDLGTAAQMYGDGMAHLQLAGNIADAINGSIILAEIRIAQGRLREAMRIYERGLGLATAQNPAPPNRQPAPGGPPLLRGTADVYVGMSVLHCERDDLQAAMRHLQSSMDLGEPSGFPQNRYRRCIALARLRDAQGDLDGALDLLDEAERLYMSDFSPNVRPIAALKARVWIAQGRLGQALDWAREQGISVEDDLDYRREFEHITLARVLLARYRRDRDDRSLHEAIGLLERLLHAAERGERTGSVIEILVVQALAYQAQGDIPPALEALECALTMAEPEGYIRLFVDEGQPMAALLAQSVVRSTQNDSIKVYSERLLSVFPQAQSAEQRVQNNASALRSAPPRGYPRSSALIEPLSERELEVLRLFTTELSGPEIARELMVALSTVRTHTKSIFSKLDVNNRRAAVKRAAELHLI
jgi:LuxR family transcriptional regulator, maltose regulon positive regulatory protein